MSSTLISFLQANNNCFIADLFTISLTNGQVIAATSGQQDITTSGPTPYFSQAPNLVPDSDGTKGTWSVSGTLPFNSTAGANTGGAWQATGTGGSAGFNFAWSKTINVVPGQAYWPSGWIDASHVTSGNTIWGLWSPNIATNYVVCNQTPGSSGRVTTASPWICPVGVTQVVMLCDTWGCTIANGQLLSFSNPQLEPASFYAVKYGKWSRGTITMSAGFDLTAGTVDLKFIDNTADQGGPVVFPSSNATMLQAIAGKLFLPANVGIYTAYMPTYGDTHLGTETKFIGDIIKLNAITRTSTTFTAYDLAWRLDQQSPPNLYQPGCRHTVFDPNCTLLAKNFTQVATVASGSTQSLVNLTSGLPSVGSNSLPYTLGVLTWLTGNNAGLSNKVKQQNSSTQLLLDLPSFLPVTAGDTFSIIPGCDQTFGTCLNTYNNTINYGGERFMPPGEVAL